MPSLPTELRNLLERTIVAARDESEKAARAALVRLAVHQQQPFSTLLAEERSLRNRLRAEARRLGESVESQNRDKSEPHSLLVAEVAYAQWHRMLFARFLAENGLLMHPEGVAVTLEECAELAADEGEPDAWMLAARYAARMLPGIFLQDDPATQVRFDAAGRLALERLLNELPTTVFTADDSLGWVYQFWQTKRKKEVNESGVKIGGADIAPVTQLFTEQYMVQFLLHNSLGAWWASRHAGETLPTDMEYLRRNDTGEPAAGSFSTWPDYAADLRILDPCCGSGHFLVAAFAILCRFRMAEESLSERDAGDAVIRDNLFGLELDPRCTQIAAFSVALAAWKAGGYRELPLPNIACAGLPVGASAYEFTHLADGDPDMEAMLRRLHHVFRNAPDLGSMIDPIRIAQEEGIFAIEWGKVGPLLEEALAKERADDPAAAIFGATVIGVARAAEFLTRRYHLVVTNVPYLARGKQDAELRKHIETYHNDAKADLATAFVDRCMRFCMKGGSVAFVTPQAWWFLGSYAKFRERMLTVSQFHFAATLGEEAWQTFGIRGPRTVLLIASNNVPLSEHYFSALDAFRPLTIPEKIDVLSWGAVKQLAQSTQLRNPDSRIALEEHVGGILLERYADCFAGVLNGDSARLRRCVWEVVNRGELWFFQQSTVEENENFGGRQMMLEYDMDGGHIRADAEYRRDRLHDSDKRGNQAWGKWGVAVSQMRNLPVTLYTGELFDSNIAVILPHSAEHLSAIWAFCKSPEFSVAVRRIDQKLNVTNATLVKVPFDLERWEVAAAEQYPNGLPEPHSDDPTQWIFHGHPGRSTEPLHVAAARLLGYHWPQNGADDLDRFSDADGIVCLPPITGEPPAAQRLRELLASAYGANWTPAEQERLLTDAGHGGRDLEAWLREGFFIQHCRLFHNRPFLWQIWDGLKDGFSAIVNYHRLTRQNLERLTYTYVQSWINAQRDADGRGVAGANARLVAALALQEKLQAILEGEPPYDIYVRWKPLHQQPIGWEPDINDGVRLNVRPFVTAGILRAKFSVNWHKDRGTNPDGSERLNDLHLTRAEKEKARRT